MWGTRASSLRIVLAVVRSWLLGCAVFASGCKTICAEGSHLVDGTCVLDDPPGETDATETDPVDTDSGS